MSLSRENVIWQSGEDWYIGFFDYSVWGDDPEWDVEYDFSRFWWASGPHCTREEARDSWHGPNPGGHTTDLQGAERYDQMFRSYRESRGRLWRDRFPGAVR